MPTHMPMITSSLKDAATGTGALGAPRFHFF